MKTWGEAAYTGISNNSSINISQKTSQKWILNSNIWNPYDIQGIHTLYWGYYLPLMWFCRFRDPLATIISDTSRDEFVFGGSVAPTVAVTEVVDAER